MTLPTSPPGWYVDRTRYEAGFTCPWRRLLGFHALSTGLSPRIPHLPLVTGILVHKALELLLTNPDATASPDRGAFLGPGRYDAAEAVREALVVWESELNQAPDWTLPSDTRDLIEALTHGYARTVAPSFLADFEILHIEQEFTLPLDHPSMPLIWMARPDLVCRHRATGIISIHDFKTTSYWKDSYLREWADSLQLMMNAHVVSQALSESIPHYYVHFLVKGSADYPSPLTHAWYRPASPPLEPDDWQIKKPYRRGGLPYSRIPVSSQRPLAEWIWSLPADVISKAFLLAGPFIVSPSKVSSFIAGLPANEWWWKESLISLHSSPDLWDLDSPTFRLALDRTFPRTFNCYTYNSRCAYYDLCLHRTPWQRDYLPRRPHHATEQVEE